MSSDTIKAEYAFRAIGTAKHELDCAPAYFHEGNLPMFIERLEAARDAVKRAIASLQSLESDDQ